MSTKRVRSALGTWNNYDDESINKIKKIPYRYLVIGKEVGPECGTPHLHFYIQLEKQTSLSKLRKTLPCDLRAINGTPKQAADYCKKDNCFEEFGELMESESGGEKEKRRWREIYDLAKEGRIEKVAELEPRVALIHYKTLRCIASDNTVAVAIERKCIWITGNPKCGKTRMATETYPDAYMKIPNKWWDLYNKNKVVIIDDLEIDQAKMLKHHIKRWADRYKVYAEIKGGCVALEHEILIITSNYSLDECFIANEDWQLYQAMKRRFTYYNMKSYNPETKTGTDINDIEFTI